MNMLDTVVTPTLIGIFFLLLGKFQWNKLRGMNFVELKKSRPGIVYLDYAVVPICVLYGFIILYGVVRGAMV